MGETSEPNTSAHSFPSRVGLLRPLPLRLSAPLPAPRPPFRSRTRLDSHDTAHSRPMPHSTSTGVPQCIAFLRLLRRVRATRFNAWAASCSSRCVLTPDDSSRAPTHHSLSAPARTSRPSGPVRSYLTTISLVCWVFPERRALSPPPRHSTFLLSGSSCTCNDGFYAPQGYSRRLSGWAVTRIAAVEKTTGCAFAPSFDPRPIRPVASRPSVATYPALNNMPRGYLVPCAGAPSRCPSRLSR
jgi:hypothetical protein